MAKKGAEKEVKVPQVEIDGQKVHADAVISFGIVNASTTIGEGPNMEARKKFQLVKLVTLGNKVVTNTVIRESKDLATIYNQLDLEVRKGAK